MSNKRCPQCGFVDFADAESCKRCGAQLLTARQAEFRERRDAPPPGPPARRTSSFSVALVALVALAVAAIVVLSIVSRSNRVDLTEANPSAPPAAQSAPPPVSEAVSKRRQFARGLQSMTLEGAILKNIAVTTGGAGDKTLVITADDVLDEATAA